MGATSKKILLRENRSEGFTHLALDLSAANYFKIHFLPCLTKLAAQKLISNNYGPTYGMDAETGESTSASYFSFLGAWQIELKFSYRQELRRLIVSAVGFDPEVEGICHSFHYHPGIKDSSKWSCVSDYETGPHFHLYAKEDVKLAYPEKELAIDCFFRFIASRHHKTKSSHISSMFKPEHKMATGLMAANC
jgi:hypothetical protein